MVKSLLVGVNGSRWSGAAVDVALDWARSLDVPVTFLGAVDVEGLTGQSVPIGTGRFRNERDARVVATERTRISEALAAAFERGREIGVQCRTLLVDGGPARELGREAHRHDLLVVGKRTVPASDPDPETSETMTEIVRRSARPVVVVSGPAPTIGPIVIAYGGSNAAARALGSFVASGLYADHPIQLVGIGNDEVRMRATLKHAEDYLAHHGRTFETRIVPEGDGIPFTLRSFVEANPAKLLVMGVYGRRGLRALLFGSTTRSLLASAPSPLFVDR